MSELRMSLQSLMVAVLMVLLILSPCPGTAAPPGEPDDDGFDYDLNSEDWENLDVNIYGDSYDYDDLDQEVRNMFVVTVIKQGWILLLDLLQQQFSDQTFFCCSWKKK